jgi:hypothetical protein
VCSAGWSPIFTAPPVRCVVDRCSDQQCCHLAVDDCTDEQPAWMTFACVSYRNWGQCSASWMNGSCRRTCGWCM